MTVPPPPITAVSNASTIAESLGTEALRTVTRGINSVEYLSTAAPPVGLTPKETIHESGTLKLYHYVPQSDEVYRTPVLLVMSLVSKPYILDLAPGQSLVEFLLQQGYDVYMLDWGVPRPEDTRLQLEDYVLKSIPECIRLVNKDSGEPEVSLIGYCLGGLLSVLYTALHPDALVRNLVCFTTPIDFHGMELFSRWSDRRHFDVDHVVDTLGNVPPEMLLATFEMLRPASRVVSRVRLWDNMWNGDVVRSFRMLDRWAADQIPFPGEAFRQVVKELQWDNKLLVDDFELGDTKVDVARVKVPFLHIVAEHDHIVPYSAAKPLISMVGSDDKEEMLLKGGHVSLVAGGNATYRLWPRLDSWLAGRSA